MSDLLLQSPPGQINDVYNDLIVLTNIDKAPFKQHNLLQNIPVTLLPSNENVVLGEDVTLIPDSEDPDSDIMNWKGAQYKIDHITLEATRIEGSSAELNDDPVRDVLEKAIAEYVGSYYQTGVSSIHQTNDGYAIYIVGNAYNPNNFWAGRWREVWHYTKSGTLAGKLNTQIHYYEDGNVQLNSSQSFSFSDLPNDIVGDSAVSLVKAVQKAAVAFQTVINNSFVDTGVNAFKNLRRVLPITRSKIEWGSILSYKIGAELNSL